MFLVMIALAGAWHTSPAPSVSPLAQPASGNLGEFVFEADYPPEASLNDEEGTVGFRLSIGGDGRVTGCAVTSTSHSASLDEMTCQIMRERARLQPARGPDGQPVEDVMDARLTWRIETVNPASSGEMPPVAMPAHRARPVAPLNDYVTAEDAPVGEWRVPARGISLFRLSVDPAGRVVDCRVMFPASPQLDEAACRALRDRARFVPARNAAGQAVADEHWGHVHWGGATHPPLPSDVAPRLGAANLASYVSNDDYPAESLRNREEGTVGFRLQIGADGLPHGCSVIRSSGFPSLDTRTCEILMIRARFRPARDQNGRPINDHFEGRITWRIAT